MTLDAPVVLLIAAVIACGVGTGASLDQSIKQLPVRHRIGVVAYSDYSREADVRLGLFWYVPLGAGWVAVNVAAAVVGWVEGATGGRAVMLGVLVAAVLAHGVLTAFAAPTLRSQRLVAGDEPALGRIFDRFARLQLVRAGVDLVALTAAVGALIITMAEAATST